MAFLGLLESDFLLFFRWKDVRLHHSELEKETDSGKQGQDPRRNQVLMGWHCLNSWIQPPMECFSYISQLNTCFC